MKEYRKLIRDRIPEIIEDAGKEYETKIVKDEDYFDALKDKLDEEVEEYQEEEEVEELADIMEVLDALMEWHGINREELEEIRRKKKEERGGFEKGLFLLRAEE